MRLTILVLSLVLGLVPLLGIGWIFATGMITPWPPSATVDGLFMTLILLTLSLCFLLNAFCECRDHGLLKFLQKNKPAAKPAPSTPAKSVPVTAGAASAPPAAKVSS